MSHSDSDNELGINPNAFDDNDDSGQMPPLKRDDDDDYDDGQMPPLKRDDAGFDINNTSSGDDDLPSRASSSKSRSSSKRSSKSSKKSKKRSSSKRSSSKRSSSKKMEHLDDNDDDNNDDFSGRRPPNQSNESLDEDDDLISEAPSMTPSMAEEASFIGSVSGIPTDEELGIDDYRASRKQHQERRKLSQERFYDEENTLHDIDEETAQDHDDEYFEDYQPRGSRNYAGSYHGGNDDYYDDDPSYRSGRSGSRRGSSRGSHRGSHRDSSRRGSQQQFSLFNTLDNIDQNDSDESEPDILPGRRQSMRNRGSDRSLQRPEQNMSYHNEMMNKNNGNAPNNNPKDDDEHERPVWFWPLVTGACCCLIIIAIVIVVVLLLLSGGENDDGNALPQNITRVRPTPRPSNEPTLAPTISARPSASPITPTTPAPVTAAPSVSPTARMPELICWSRNVAADWFVHANAAQSFQGSLVTIPDTTVQNHVELAINNGGGQRGQVWIGLNDNDQEGTYVWAATGEELNVKGTFGTNAFAFGQPDNGGGTFVNLENCIQIDSDILPADSGFYAWRDSDCFSAATAMYQLPEFGKYRLVGETLPVFQSTQCASEAWNLGNFGGCVNEAGEVLPPCSGANVVDVNQDRIFCRNDGLGSWFFHASVAQRYGGSMVQIQDEATNNLIKLLANSGNAPAWIGLNANPSGSGWIWSWGLNPTGTATVLNVGDAGAFFDFAPNQPSAGAGETCVSLSPTDEYQWNDDVCGTGHKGVYQLPRLATCYVLQAGGGFDCVDGSGNALTELNSC